MTRPRCPKCGEGVLMAKGKVLKCNICSYTTDPCNGEYPTDIEKTEED